MSDHVCFAGPLPPPVHGMSAVNAAMVAALGERGCVTAINTGPRSLERGGLGYHTTRLMRVAVGLFRMLVARLQGARTLYASVDDGLGGVWTLAFIGTARLLGMRRFLHHHSFRYIDAPTALMRLLVRITGRDGEHVLLCSTMERRFAAAYPRAGPTTVVANNVPAPDEIREPSPRPRTIGMLANLTFEKGLRDFIAILDRDVSLHGILAGPVPDADAAAFVVDALHRLGGRLQSRGPVHGAAKEAFFEDIDTFVFPTRYRTEAYPLVLLEALVRGVPVVAPDRGCIGALSGLDAATIVPLDAYFPAAAGQALATPMSRERRVLVRAEGLALNAENTNARTVLLDRLTGRHITASE